MVYRPLGALVLIGLLSSAASAESPVVHAGGHLLKPGPKRAAGMYLYEDRIRFAVSESDYLIVERADIKGIEYQSGKRRASVGTMFTFGVIGAIAGKRTMTTIGIAKTDGEIIIFRMKGKDLLHVTMALDQFMETLETEGVLPTEASGEPCSGRETCTLGQIAAMARAGLPDEKIEAACSDSR